MNGKKGPGSEHFHSLGTTLRDPIPVDVRLRARRADSPNWRRVGNSLPGWRDLGIKCPRTRCMVARSSGLEHPVEIAALVGADPCSPVMPAAAYNCQTQHVAPVPWTRSNIAGAAAS